MTQLKQSLSFLFTFVKQTLTPVISLTAKFSLIAFAFYAPYKLYNALPKHHHAQIANNINLSYFTHNSSNKYNPIVKLHLFLEEGEGYCSGTVVDSTHIITAAHCTPGLIVGRTYATDTTEVAHAAITDYHSNFRADYSVLIGDFSKFNGIPAVLDKPLAVSSVGEVVATCGFPMGQKDLICAQAKIVSPIDSQILAVGEMYPGMSGGPVLVSVPLIGPIVIAVNTGTWGQAGGIPASSLVFSPLVGITAL